ncbi:hypothetical protein [Rhodocista pekingensis]|uniref:Uncharacterized protein n=1 Tax=Rhodocista pekingensis TaxID=201185 RepID=A0ABW2KZL2_9PROT
MDHLAVWKRALPLSRACLRFAPREMAERLELLRRQTSLSAVTGRVRGLAEDGALTDRTDMARRMALLSSALGPVDEERRLMEAMRASCLALIQEGRVLALGYALPRAVTDRPVPVPAELWQHPVDWEGSRLAGNGLRMEAVRLALPHWLPQIMADAAAAAVGTVTPRPAPRGRPSKRDAVIAAFRHLADAGSIRPERPLAEHYPAIRALVMQATDGTPAGLTDKTLHRLLKPLFDRLR